MGGYARGTPPFGGVLFCSGEVLGGYNFFWGGGYFFFVPPQLGGYFFSKVKISSPKATKSVKKIVKKLVFYLYILKFSPAALYLMKNNVFGIAARPKHEKTYKNSKCVQNITIKKFGIFFSGGVLFASGGVQNFFGGIHFCSGGVRRFLGGGGGGYADFDPEALVPLDIFSLDFPLP